MEMTAAASWLMSAFSGLDLGILSLLHTLSEHAGGLLTPLAKLVTLLGEKGILFPGEMFPVRPFPIGEILRGF